MAIDEDESASKGNGKKGRGRGKKRATDDSEFRATTRRRPARSPGTETLSAPGTPAPGTPAPGTPSVVGGRASKEKGTANHDQKTKEWLEKLTIISILNDKVGKAEIYQGKRHLGLLDRGGYQTQAVQMDARLKVCHHALMLTKDEIGKINLDQVKVTCFDLLTLGL